MRLGDHYLNAASNTTQATTTASTFTAFTALSALSTASQARSTIVLGDRGDGTRVSKE